MSFHQTVVVGNLGRDPELKYLQSGRAVCSFSVAVTERWTDRQNNNEKREKTTWYRVSAWGPLGENCAKFLAKGRQVLVVGTVESRGYINQAGEAASSLELTARDVQFLGSRSDAVDDNGYGGSGGYQGEDDFAPPPSNEDDIPF